MSLRSWLLLAFGLLLVQTVLAQEQMRTYDPKNSGARRQSIEPPLLEGDAPLAKLKSEEPKPLPADVQVPAKNENGLLPAQQIVPRPVTSQPQQIASGTLLATPVVTIDVVGSENAAEGIEIKYTFTVRNRSDAKAHHVLIRGIVPRNAKFIQASVPATTEKVGEVTELHWAIGTLNPGETRSIDAFFLPNLEETEIKVLGRVQIDHGRWLVTKIAKPGIVLKKTAPKEGVLYDAINYRLEVSNPSKISITDIKIEDQLGKDDGMEYERDPNAKIDNEKNQRTWSIPSLAPGEKRVFDFTVIAKKTGLKNTLTRVTASGVAPVVEEHQITIHEARLQIKLTPAPQATVGQPAEVKILVENKGTAMLNNVTVNIAHPLDIEVKKATNGSQFFKDGVQWILPKLSAGENRELSVFFSTKTPGRRKFTVTTKADKGQEQKDDTTVDFEGIASLNWKTDGTQSSTEGKDVNYTVEVYNPGTANATNVILRVKLPPEVRFVTANPLFTQDESHGLVTFKPIHVPPKTKATFAINCLAVKKGFAAFHFDLFADHHSKKSGGQHSEMTTTINARETPVKLDRTTQNQPNELPIKEGAKIEPPSDPIVPVSREPRKEKEPKRDEVPKNSSEVKPEPAPKQSTEPGEIPKFELTAPLSPVDKKEPEKKDPEKKSNVSPIVPLDPPKP